MQTHDGGGYERPRSRQAAGDLLHGHQGHRQRFIRGRLPG